METFGLLAFVAVIFMWSKLTRLERTLRENNIRPGGTAGSPAGRLRDWTGRTVTITLYEGGGATTTLCKVLDADEEWAHVIRNEGKWNQRELLIRLSDIKQIKP